MDRALEAEAGQKIDTPPLAGSTTCDVLIVGGGFTGLWTALMIKRQSPETDVVVIDAEYCGAGASGRNGGFATTWWHDLDALDRNFGREQALFLARASSGALDEMEGACEEFDFDAHFVRGGKLCVSAASAQDGWWREAQAVADESGEGDRFVELDGDECRRRIGSPVLREGMLLADSATVQPALMVRGLRKAALRVGVRIHERTEMTSLDRDGVRVVTPGGTISAGKIVMAINAWAAQMPELNGVVVPLSSHMVITEPLGDRLDELGWTGGEKLVDGRMLVHYAHVTKDRRIAFGRGGGAVGYRGKVGGRVVWDERLAARVADDFRWFFPELSDVRMDGAWGGAVDRCWRHLPFFSPLPGQDRILVGAGYSGDGVGPSVVGAKVLASLALDHDDEWSRSALVDLPDHRRMPPEPFRKIGGELVRGAIEKIERRQERGHETALVASAVSKLAWLTIPGRR